MKRVSLLAFVLLASYASAIVINDPSALPPIENGINGFLPSSSEKAIDFISVSPLLPANEDSGVKFGSRQKPFVLKHNPSLLPAEEIPVSPLGPILPVSTVGPIFPVSRVPVQPQQPIIPVTEGQLMPPHKKHRRPHLPRHQRKHLPHVPKHHCECAIPIIPDHSKPQRHRHLAKHSRKAAAEKRPHLLLTEQNNFIN